MKHRFCRKTVQVVMAFTLLMSFCAVPRAAHAASAAEKPVLVGLAYGSGAEPGGNLINAVGSGYRLGYLDSERNFVQLGSTPETGVSVVKTENVYYGGPFSNGFKGYSDQITSSIAVGCYHIQLPGSYSTFEEAASAARAISGGFPAWINGTYYVRKGAYLNGGDAKAALNTMGADGASILGTSEYGVSVVKTGTSTVLFQFDAGQTHSLTLMPIQVGTARAETWFLGSKYYGGFQFQRVNGGNMTITSVVDPDAYISCVISREMSNSWPLEALKAQAVAARSYCATNYGRHSASQIDICPTTHCQVYSGCGSAGENTLRAAQETSGEYIKYDGQIIQAFYYSSNGGASENSENVWSAALPYLRGVADPYEADVASRILNYNWTKTFTGDQLQARLSSAGYTRCGEIQSVSLTKTATGNVYSMTFLDENGRSWTISKEYCRTVLGMNSMRFDLDGTVANPGSGNAPDTPSDSSAVYVIDESGTVTQISGPYYILAEDGTAVQQSGTTEETENAAPTPSTSGAGSVTPANGTFTFRGSGLGHNVGMSQWGAYAMAQKGLTYRDILTFYYTGVTIGS